MWQDGPFDAQIMFFLFRVTLHGFWRHAVAAQEMHPL